MYYTFYLLTTAILRWCLLTSKLAGLKDAILTLLLECEICRGSHPLDATNLVENVQVLQQYNIVVIRVTKQYNSINGTLKENDRFYFFKTGHNEEMVRELVGYRTIRDKYPCPNLLRIYILNKQIFLIFEYEATVGSNFGTLTDYITVVEQGFCPHDEAVFNGILDCYRRHLHTVKKRRSFPNDMLFAERLKSRLLPWYTNDELFSYTFIINNRVAIKPALVIYELESFFSRRRKMLCMWTQGDPVDRNIGIKPVFFDFGYAGYNCVMGEIAVFLWAIYGGRYYSPKYYPNSYLLHSNIYYSLNSAKPKCSFVINSDRKSVTVSIEHSISAVCKSLLIDYLESYLQDTELRTEANETLNYHIAMRIATVLNMREMDLDDQIASISIMIILYLGDGKDYVTFLQKLILQDISSILYIDKS